MINTVNQIVLDKAIGRAFGIHARPPGLPYEHWAQSTYILSTYNLGTLAQKIIIDANTKISSLTIATPSLDEE